jgi:hypothetical protein
MMQRQWKFYSWIPNFCQYIQFNEENILILEKIKYNQVLECVQIILKMIN